jgi:hypothetical protein
MASTAAEGTYIDCGYGMPASVLLACNGPSCGSISESFPSLICTSDATTSNCNNGVTCPGPVNFISKFAITQEAAIVSSQQNLTIDSLDFSGTDSGTGTVSYGNDEIQQPAPPIQASSTPVSQPATTHSSMGTPNSTSVTTVRSSSLANRRFTAPQRSVPNLMILFILIMSVFIAQTNAQPSLGNL